jgi:hypothetical protein
MEFTTISFLTTDTQTTDNRQKNRRFYTQEKRLFCSKGFSPTGIDGDAGMEFTTISFLTTDTPMTDI